MKSIQRKILLASAVLMLVLLGTGSGSAQTAPPNSGSGTLLEGSIVVYVWEAAPTFAEGSGEAVDPRLSRNFALSGLEAVNVLRAWQEHLAYSIRNGYPLSDAWVAVDREQADLALQRAALTISTDADRIALRMLVNQFESLRQWSDGLLQDNRNMRLAEYYISPAGLGSDVMFQKTAACGNFLGPMLSSGRVTDYPACH